MNTLIAIILYNKEIESSLTINSLLNNSYQNYDLVVINNGPNVINYKFFEETLPPGKIRNFFFEEYLDNKPLSFLYNEVISKYQHADRFILLDDDSLLDANFFFDIDCNLSSENEVDLQVLKIIDNKTGIEFYPRYNGIPVEDQYRHNSKEKYFFYSIGSGLVIYKNLVDKMKDFYPDLFDTRFALYGVDVSLFRRIKMIESKGVFVNIQVVSKINHSLSRTETVIPDWRYKERLFDSVLSTKYYSRNKFYLLYHFVRLILIEVSKLNINNIKLIFTTFYTGKHPRT